MNSEIAHIFTEYGIEFFETVPFDERYVINRGLFERTVSGFAKNVIVFLAPYRTCAPEKHNVSLYAAPQDYHFFMKELFADAEPKLEAAFRGRHFRGMSDHSPINETLAAAEAGLGVIGDNSRLINEKYGSYVFIGEIFTDAEIDAAEPIEPRECLHCGACKSACPYRFDSNCLSAVTQRKGDLSASEVEIMRKCGTVWGCDICQEVCPMNVGAAMSKIAFFNDSLIFNIDAQTLADMDDGEFARRAFSWRGRGVIERNIGYLYPN